MKFLKSFVLLYRCLSTLMIVILSLNIDESSQFVKKKFHKNNELDHI